MPSQYETDISKLLSSNLDLSNFLAGEGKKRAQRGQDITDPLIQSDIRLLRGDRQAASEELAPQFRSVLDYYDAARRSTAEFSPRGGGKSSRVAESYFDQAGALSSLVGREKTAAREDLRTLGPEMSRLGLQAVDQAGNLNLGVISNLVSLRGQDKLTDSQFGAGLGSIINALLYGVRQFQGGYKSPPLPSDPTILGGGGGGGGNPDIFGGGGIDFPPDFPPLDPGWGTPPWSGGGGGDEGDIGSFPGEEDWGFQFPWYAFGKRY